MPDGLRLPVIYRRGGLIANSDGRPDLTPQVPYPILSCLRCDETCRQVRWSPTRRVERMAKPAEHALLCRFFSSPSLARQRSLRE